MSNARKYDPELKARAVRMYIACMEQGGISQAKARAEIGEL